MLGINKILAYVRRQVGLRTDAADATGSALARLKHITDSAIPSVQNPRGLQKITYVKQGESLNTFVDTTVLNLTGRGVLRQISILNNSGFAGGLTYCEIIVDGVTLFPRNGQWPLDSGQVRYFDRFLDLGALNVYAETDIPFKSSLQVIVPFKTGWSSGDPTNTWFTATMFVEVE